MDKIVTDIASEVGKEAIGEIEKIATAGNVQNVANMIESEVEKVIKVIDSNKIGKEVLDTITAGIVQEVSNSSCSCSLFGLVYSLHITPKNLPPAPAKSEASPAVPSA